MRIWVVGSGTLIPSPTRGSPAHWVEVGRSSLLLDCGAGTLRTLAGMGLDWGGVSQVLLTHFHTDHTGDLAPLLFAMKHGLPRARQAPLTILGPVGLVGHLEALAAAHGSYVRDPGFPLVVWELTPGAAWRAPDGEFWIKTVGTPHTENSLAVRVESADGVLGYTGDTGPDSRLGPFFLGCHLLLAECSDPDPAERENHLSPRGLASLASHAKPECLVTVHCYPSLDPESVPGLLASHGYAGRVLPGRDGLGMDLKAGTVELVESGRP